MTPRLRFLPDNGSAYCGLRAVATSGRYEYIRSVEDVALGARVSES